MIHRAAGNPPIPRSRVAGWRAAHISATPMGIDLSTMTKTLKQDRKMTDEDNQIPVELAREIERQGEVRLAALMTIGIAADSRANALCGILGAICIAVLAGVVACIALNPPLPKVVSAGVVVATALFVSAIMAAWAGAPRDFYIPGGHPKKLRLWSWTDTGWRNEAEMLDASAVRYALLIERNSRILETGSKRFIRALTLAGTALPLGVLVYCVW